jgi:Domain of unknown function (DUF4129)
LPKKSTICRLTSCLIFLLAFFALTVGARAQDSSRSDGSAMAPPMDAPSFAAELRRLQSVVEKNQATSQQIAQVRTSLPEQWEVKTADGDYEISSAPLGSLLQQAEQNSAQRPKLIGDAKEWLEEEASQVESYTPAEADRDSDARAALGAILARREFSGVRTQSARDLLQQRINQWLVRIVEWFIEHVGRHATSAKLFFELLLFAIVVWLATVLVRFWMRRARIDELQAPDPVTIARSWQEWIRAAREASERGDFREAVHSAYWAGIAYLEAAELIEPDRTRTPREYVRLLAKPRADAATPLEKPRAALAALTARLEQVWYGHRPASREDFAESMRQIEGLGCQLP